MFIRADLLLPSASPSSFQSQAIDFHWKEFEPHLTYLTTRGSLECYPLERLNMIVSEARRCVGYFDEQGHHPCPDRAVVRSFSQCDRCASTWIPKVSCLFEPECDGTLCDSPLCSREHVVYAAFTGRLVKVGMTSSRRLRTRGIEQGADAVVPLFVAPNRKRAREIEKRVSTGLNLPQRFHVRTIAGELFRLPPEEELLKRCHRLLERLPRSLEALGERPMMLTGYPASPLPHPPKPAKTMGFHTGRVLGIKGRFLVYEDEETGVQRMLNLGDLPSRFLHTME